MACRPSFRGDKIELSAYEVNYGQNGGEVPIQVSATSQWRAYPQSGWVTATSSSDDICTITAAPNDSVSRSTSILFVCGKDSATVTVSQAHKEEFSIYPLSTTFTYKGGTAQIDVRCFDEWKIKDKSGWIETDITEGKGPERVSVRVAETEMASDTSGTIIFISGDEEIVFDLIQLAKPFVETAQDTIRIDGDGGYISLLYLTNSDIIPSSTVPWIRLTGHNTASKRVHMEIFRNEKYEKRDGAITLTCKEDTTIRRAVIIHQGEKIDHPALGFEEGHTINISERDTLTLHPIFTDMKDSTLIWSSTDPSIASAEQNGRVAIHRSGECRITIYNPHHNISAEITLKVRLHASGMTIMLGSQNMDINNTAVRFQGEEMVITAIMEPEGSYDEDIVCYSSNKSAVAVDGMNVKCISPGSATITIESQYNKIQKSFKILVIE